MDHRRDPEPPGPHYLALKLRDLAGAGDGIYRGRPIRSRELADPIADKALPVQRTRRGSEVVLMRGYLAGLVNPEPEPVQLGDLLAQATSGSSRSSTRAGDG